MQPLYAHSLEEEAYILNLLVIMKKCQRNIEKKVIQERKKQEMNKLWAPWRIDYIRTPKEEGCVFCNKSQSTNMKKNLVLFKGKECFILNEFLSHIQMVT